MVYKIGWIAALSLGMFGKWVFLSESPFKHPKMWTGRDSGLFWLLAVFFVVGAVFIMFKV